MIYELLFGLKKKRKKSGKHIVTSTIMNWMYRERVVFAGEASFSAPAEKIRWWSLPPQ